MINISNASTILRLAGKMNRSRFQIGRSATRVARVIVTSGRLSARMALVILAAGFFLSINWHSQAFSHSAALSASTEEGIATYSSAALTTPKTSFNVGETVWALETGLPSYLLGSYRPRRFQWVAPDGTIVKESDIATDAQSDSYPVPTAAQVGTWTVMTVDNSSVGFAITQFVVHDPINKSVDLSVNVFGPSQVAVGGNLLYRLQVTNNGPDDAQNVQLTDAVPSGATFQSITDVSDWSCSGGTCSTTSLAKGATATFTIVYQVDANATVDTTITNTASVSSNTTELHDPDNTSAADATVIAGAPCTFSCPGNITQAHDSGMNGATVNYTTPTISSGSCEPVSCNPPSGSFFPAGVTAVNCSSLNGGSCSFTVTVTGTLAITLNGTDPLAVECHTQFTDPGATAQDGSGNTFSVTASGNVDSNTPGTYTITYTATDGANTTTATRTVTVVDATPPTITLNGADTLTAECGSIFTDPGATASDSCAGNLTSTIVVSGSVNTSVLGSYTRTYTVSDGTNTATVARTVNVVDTTPPVISCPAGTTVTASTNCQAAVPNVVGVTASDNCTPAGSLIITQSPAAGTLVGIGTTTITITVTDAANNFSTCTTTFTVNPTQLTVLGPASVWVGLKNSDDVGTKFDLLAEVLKNGTVVGSGQLNDVSGGSSGFNNAISDSITQALSGTPGFCSGDTLNIRLSVRIATSSGHRSGTARLWFNDAAANSRFAATVGGVTNTYYLLSGFALGATAGPGPKSTIDVLVDRAVGGNPFKPFGTWSKTF